MTFASPALAAVAARRSAGPVVAPGVTLDRDGADFVVRSRHAEQVWVCLYDAAGERESARWLLADRRGDFHCGFVPGVVAGQRYGLRANGPHDPRVGHWFDPAKLLVDPYATRIDRPFVWSPDLAAPRSAGLDTAPLVPKAIVEDFGDVIAVHPADTPRFIYEVAVKAYSQRDPAMPVHLRGTIAGLAQPHVVDRLVKLGISHVELMPVAAWIDERHLPPLGLHNAWGYNPIAFMALDPRLAPGGLVDLRNTVATLSKAGIGVLLDVVFNHTGESDAQGATLSLRGLDNALYYRRTTDGDYVNDTGCGNTLACDEPAVVELVLDTLRHFVRHAGVAGFRFDLATILGRHREGFDSDHVLLTAMTQDPLLRDRVLIAEPWDIGPGGYQLGRFRYPWHEWNDRFRDDVRRFWRGDQHVMGELASRLAGSSDIFGAGHRGPRASINFVAAHDGFALRDVVSYAHKRNHANGEDNRDGNSSECSWNGGVDGETPDANVSARRKRDIRALLATLFLARGIPMLTAGDEFGRTQAGNNNAYAQDNDTSWLDWASADGDLAAFVAELAAFRASHDLLMDDRFLTGQPVGEARHPDVMWTGADGRAFSAQDWQDGDCLCMTLASRTGGGRLHLVFNRSDALVNVVLPPTSAGVVWRVAVDSAAGIAPRCPDELGQASDCAPRAVMAFVETVAAR